MFAHFISLSTQKLEEVAVKTFSLLYLPAGFAVAHWWAWVFQGQEPKTGSSPASQIFLEVFPVLRGGSDAGGRKAGSRHLQQWCFLRVSALPELMSCWGAGSGSQELLPSWNGGVDAMVLGSQFLHRREAEWWDRRREALLCLIFPGQTVCSAAHPDWLGLLGNGWRLLSSWRPPEPVLKSCS